MEKNSSLIGQLLVSPKGHKINYIELCVLRDVSYYVCLNDDELI